MAAEAASTKSLAARILDELGLLNLYECSRDVKLLIVQRFVRLFAYGGSTLILASYLAALGTSEARIGLFMTLTLVGDVAISFVMTLFADALGRRAVLALGAALMVVSGIAFGLSGNYWVLLAAAIVGIISPSGNEIGPFRALEESILAWLTPAASRSDLFAWYSLLGNAGTALGLMVCGWVVDSLQELHHWDQVKAYRVVFFAYAVVGVVKFLLVLALSSKVEAKKKPKDEPERESENAPLLGDGTGGPKKAKKEPFWRMLPALSRESAVILVKLALLFALDSFGSGLAPLTWVTYFFKQKFHLPEGGLGSLFFVASLIQAASVLVASSISKRIGNVQTMVFTHLPSAIFLALIPVPSSLPLAMAFLILRACSQSMDVAPRSAFLAAILLPHERTAIMGFINVVKTMSQSLGPVITGVLAQSHLFWVAFVMAGGSKAVYDLGILAVFVGQQSRESEEGEGNRADNRPADVESSNEQDNQHRS